MRFLDQCLRAFALKPGQLDVEAGLQLETIADHAQVDLCIDGHIGRHRDLEFARRFLQRAVETG